MYKTVTEPREKKDRVRGTIFLFQCVYRCIDCFFVPTYMLVKDSHYLDNFGYLNVPIALKHTQ